jgi:hypothetical protein
MISADRLETTRNFMPICFRRILLRGDCDARIIGFMKTPKNKKSDCERSLDKKIYGLHVSAEHCFDAAPCAFRC